MRDALSTVGLSLVLVCGPGCRTSSDAGDGTTGEAGSTGAMDETTAAGEQMRADVTHSFGQMHLDALEEAVPCVSWTLNNEQPLYVQAVTLANTGAFHHSNGFVVPEDLYPGPDGVWNCKDRGFAQSEAATTGTVLFAQSTQSWVEEQRFHPGGVIKIPPHYKVVAELHMLNLAPRAVDTELRVSLEIIHPQEVAAVLTPFSISYNDLEIPAMKESRFRGIHDGIKARYEGVVGEPFRFDLYYLLPHYHYLGNYIDFTVIGGAHDGESIHQISGFNAEPNGKTFDPPIDLSDAEGFRFTCGFDNWTDQEVGWGIGDQEMCIMVGFADSEAILSSSVTSGSIVNVDENGIHVYEGNGFALAVKRNADQGMPSDAELQAPLYVPPIDDEDQGLPPVPECEDADPGAVPEEPATLTSVAETIFVPACGFSSCHGNGGNAAGLDLSAPDLHARLMNHQVLANTDLPLVDPGNPEGSWLYQLVSRCEPTDRDGAVVANMPRNAPLLMEDKLVAKLRAWIENGALDN